MVVYVATKKWTWSLFCGYLFCVLAVTVLTRSAELKMSFQLKPFWSYTDWERQQWQVLANVIMFIPIGMTLGKELRWKGIAIAAFCSVVIEIIQLISHRGLCEFDDVFHNTVGAIIGIFIVGLIEGLFVKQK